MTTTTIGMSAMSIEGKPTAEDWARMVTVKQAAEIMHVNIWGIYKMVQRGFIPAHRIHPGARDIYMLPEDIRAVYPQYPHSVG